MPLTARMRVFEERLGLSALGASTIVAIVAALVLVSLPRLRSYATTANEEDAIATSLRLADALSRRPLPPEALPPVEEIARDHLRELTNAEFFAEGLQMRRHGYLFVLRSVPRPARTGLGRVVYANDPSPVPAIVAWPWAAGRTGTSAWVATVEGDLLALRNENGAWSGPEGLPLGGGPWSWDGWRPLR